MSANAMLRQLSNREVLGRVVLMPGLPAIALGMIMFYAFGKHVPAETLGKPYEIGGFWLPFRTWLTLTQVAMFLLPPALLIPQHYFMFRHKIVHCHSCGKTRNTDVIARLAQVKRCASCHHELRPLRHG